MSLSFSTCKMGTLIIPICRVGKRSKMVIGVYNRAWQVIRGQKVFITVSVYFSKNIYIQRQTW